jgi:hypothetical protein
MVKSFMTVDADLKGQGVGRELRRRIVEEIASHALPILRFGEPLLGVETVLAEDYGAGGLHLRPLAHCGTAAVLARGGGPAGSPDESDWAAAWHSRKTEGVVDPAPPPAEVAHYLRDPRPRTLVGVRDAEGGLAAAAMVVRAAMRTRRGVEMNVQLEQLLVGRNARPEHLARLVVDAAYWGHSARDGVVVVPNVGDTPWPLLASAGFRKQAARYSAWVASAANHPLQHAQATNLEIV